MAANDFDYCEAHGLQPCDRNLTYVRRIRLAGAWLRGRALEQLERDRDALGGGILGPAHPVNRRNAAACNAAYAFEDRAMAARKVGRDRQSRQASKPRLQLLAAAPLRRPVAQADVDGLALFDSYRSPALL